MIGIENIKIFENHKTTLKKASEDSHGGARMFMTDSLVDVINFDAVKDEYVRNLKVSETPKSNDVLFFHDDGDIYFIEFKNGKIDRKQACEIRLKIFDSLLIFTDIISKGVSFTREELNYILVYNEEKNPKEAPGKHFSKKGNKEFISFDLARFKRLYFKNVFTYTEKKFETCFVSRIGR
jgi:hypothetical protein